MSNLSPPIIACFAHERGDARVMKRVSALQAQGWSVRGYMFHRIRNREDVPPFWDNVELGVTENRRYVRRIFSLLGSLFILWKQRKRLAEVQAWYAVNTDNAFLALAGRWLAVRSGGSVGPLVLELADLQAVMLGSGLISKVMRAMERQVLGRAALLVTTSPGFVREYFVPLQQFKGPVFLLENRVYPSTGIVLPAQTGESTIKPLPQRGGRPWVIGLFGALRCPRSLSLMRAMAARFPDRVHFYLRGYPSGIDPAVTASLLRSLPNLEWAGAYQYPDDLAAIYRQIDLNWTMDYSDPSGNSPLLLPNRIYEGGLFGCPALADAASETGRWISQHGLGWTFPEPLEETIGDFLENLTDAAWQEKKAACAQLPRSVTCGEDDYAELSAAIRKLAGCCK